MSLKHYKHIWSNYPEVKGSHKLVLLALAEFANEETNECWPSVARLSEMTGLKDRQIQNLLRDLKANGYIEIETNHGRRITNVYKLIMEEKVQSTAPFSEEEKVQSSTKKVHSSTEKVQSSDVKGAVDCTRSIIEPISNNNSSQSSKNSDSENQPVVLVGKKKKQAQPKNEDSEEVAPEQQEWFGAMCWLVYKHREYALLSKVDKIAIGKAIKDIRALNYTIDDLRKWYVDIWSKEWPGKQTGTVEIQCPKIKDIKSGIGKVKTTKVSVNGFGSHSGTNKSIAVVGELEK